MIQWSGVSDANFKQMEYKIDDVAWKKLGTGTSGSVELPIGTITGNGQHKIAVRSDSSGEIEEQEMVDTVLSGTGTAPEEFEKHTGSQDYLGYQSFQTPTGNGTVEDQSGNLTYSQEDANLPASQLTFEMARTYNSQSLLNGMLGTGWSNTLHKELVKSEDGTMYYLDSDGSIYHFEKSGETYVCKETKDLTLNDGSIKTPSGDTAASVKSIQIGEMSYSYKETIAEEN